MATIDKRSVTRDDLIRKSQRTMFAVVVVASIIVGISLVGIRRLVMENIFMVRVIDQQNETLGNLRTSNRNIPALEDQIRLLQTNEALMVSRFDEEEAVLRVIPDALPSVNNEISLGTSLSERLLDVDGITIESIRTGTSATGGGISSSASGATGVNMLSVPFSFVVNGDEAAIQAILENLEKSIRFVTVGRINVTYTGRIEMNVQGVAYYVDETVPVLGSTTITMGGN